jgi:hypothetical protein
MLTNSSSTPSKTPSTRIQLWIFDLFSHYSLPSVSSPTEESNDNYTHIHKILRKHAKQNNPTFTSISGLNDIGLNQPLNAHTKDFGALPGHSGPITNLREKLILWALHVVGTERIELPDLGDHSLIRQCLYMRSFAPDRLDENWIFEESDLEKKGPKLEKQVI